jgi:hypothetical protein
LNFSNARKNPYYDKIKKYGFSITEYYSPEDVAQIIEGTCSRRIDVLNPDPEEIKAFERYKKAHGM